MPPNNAGGQDIYNRYSSSQQPANYSAGTPPNARNNSYPSAPQAHPATVPQQTATSQPSSPSQPSAASSYSCPQDYYRQEQVIYIFYFYLVFFVFSLYFFILFIILFNEIL